MNFNEILLDGARDGKIELVEYALKNGADVNAKDNDGQTALHLASWQGTAEIVRLLLASGADVNAKDCIGQTALHVAVLNSNLEIVRLLLEYGADVNAKDDDKCTALHVAVLNSNLEIVKILEDYIKSQEKPKLSIDINKYNIDSLERKELCNSFKITLRITEDEFYKVKYILGEI